MQAGDTLVWLNHGYALQMEEVYVKLAEAVENQWLTKLDAWEYKGGFSQNSSRTDVCETHLCWDTPPIDTTLSPPLMSFQRSIATA